MVQAVNDAPAAQVAAAEAIEGGRELKRRLARAQRMQKWRAFMLVAPLLFFVLLTFIAPIGNMLTRSVDNAIVPEVLPRTTVAIADWDPAVETLPGEPVFRAMVLDLIEARENKTNTRLGTRLNYEMPGVASLFRSTPRKLTPRSSSRQAALQERFETEGYKGVLIETDDEWGDPALWLTIQTFSGVYTSGYFAQAIDGQLKSDGVYINEADERIYGLLAWRTLWMSMLITVMTLLLGYPIAYLLATLPLRTSNLLLILVLLPFWTSLLVRTSAWIILLQNQGVVNDALNFTGLNTPFYVILSSITTPNVTSQCATDIQQVLVSGAAFLDQVIARGGAFSLSTCGEQIKTIYQSNGEQAAIELARQLKAGSSFYGYGDERFAMIFNITGTVVAMTHILLPFMILPLYSVMKTLSPSYVRAAKSLGASNWTAFWRVYFPNTIPGIGAGAILVFILAIGYYITPELVGGTAGTFISNRIAFHISSSLNWGLAAALGALLLIAVLILYYAYDRIVGIDNVKLG